MEIRILIIYLWIPQIKNFIIKKGKKINEIKNKFIKLWIITIEKIEIIIWPEIILIVNRRIIAIGWIIILTVSIKTIKKDKAKGHPKGQRCSKKEFIFLIFFKILPNHKAETKLKLKENILVKENEKIDKLKIFIK